MTPHEALVCAVNIIGSQVKTAEACNLGVDDPAKHIKQQHVHGWIKRGNGAPAKYCLRLEAATEAKGEKISARNLCPEMFEGIGTDAA